MAPWDNVTVPETCRTCGGSGVERMQKPRCTFEAKYPSGAYRCTMVEGHGFRHAPSLFTVEEEDRYSKKIVRVTNSGE